MEAVGAILETGGAAAAELAASALSHRGHCANCGAALTGRFCADCGQSADDHRRSVRHLVGDLVTDIVSLDSRILRTTLALLFRPGELALAFREGRTQRYVPPIRLYLFVSLIFFLALEISNVALMQFVLQSERLSIVKDHGVVYSIGSNGSRTVMPAHYADNQAHYTFNTKFVFLAREGTLHANLPPEAIKRLNAALTPKPEKHGKVDVVARTVFGTLQKLANDPAALNGALTAWIPRALFLLLPLFALLLAAFYWRQRQSFFFVDHLVFSLGFHSFAFAMLLVAAALAQGIGGELAMVVMDIVLAVYLLLAMKTFYRQNWWWTAIKFGSVAVLYASLCVIPAFAAVLVASVMWG